MGNYLGAAGDISHIEKYGADYLTLYLTAI